MNEFELQRLVDGEGDDQWRANLLASLGEDSSQWRELALRLLEDQRLKKHFRLSQRSIPMVPASVTPASVTPASVATLATESLPRVDGQRTGSPRTDEQRAGNRGWSTVAFAASLLFLVIGSSAYYKSLRPSAESPSGLGETPERPLASNETKGGDIQADPVPAGRVQWLVSSDSDDLMETPVYAVSQVAPEMLVDEQAMRLLRANTRLNRQGWNANFDTKVYEGQMEDGRRMIVPVNVVRVEPVGY